MPDSWQTELAQSITDINVLCRILDLPQRLANQGLATAQQYPLRVCRPFVHRIEKGNPDDPLLLQILPQDKELRIADGFTADPLEETRPPVMLQQEKNCGVLQKYAGRTLLLTTNQCGMYCRFCFRRWTRTETRADNCVVGPNISEVILSGGDPLMLSDDKLFQLVNGFRENPTIKRIRIHTRLPVILPSRITDALLSLINTVSCGAIYLVFHINHLNELSDEFFEMISRIRGAVLLSQTVLLKGVNDNADTLATLFETLVNHRIVPYYLHQLDKVQGAAHFEVPPPEGLKIMTQLEKRLPGYAVPKYVREVPNEAAKVQIRPECTSAHISIEQFHEDNGENQKKGQPAAEM